jgi:hypothetical protein
MSCYFSIKVVEQIKMAFLFTIQTIVFLFTIKTIVLNATFQHSVAFI